MLPAVEQDDGEPIAELGAQPGITRRSGGVDVDGGQIEVQFGGQFAEPVVDPLTEATAVPGEQFDVRPRTGTITATIAGMHTVFTWGAAHHGQCATRPIG